MCFLLLNLGAGTSSVMLETDHGHCCLQGLDSALEVELQAGDMLYLPAGVLQQPYDKPSCS